MRDNPLPVTLIGAGVAWPMSGRGGAIRTDRRDSRDDYSFEDQQGRRRRLTAASAQQGLDDSFGTPYTEADFYSSGESDAEGDRKRASWGFRRRAGEAAGEVRKAGEHLSEKASEAERSISDAASQGTEAIGEAVSSAGHRIESLRRNASRRAARIGRGVYRSGTNAPGSGA